MTDAAFNAGPAPPLGASRATLIWLVRHELRLAMRDRSMRLRTRVIVAIIVLVLPVLIGTAMAWRLRDAPAVPYDAFGLLVAINAGLVLMMLSGASVYVLRSFHDRGDLDLLLAAPIPARRVMAAKAVAVHASVSLPLLVVFSPFLIASALFGHPGWLGGIVMIVVTAVFATSLAFGVATLLFRLVGARRARMAIQVGGGVFAAVVAIGGQAPTFAPRYFSALGRVLAAPPPAPFDWPARAMFGEPLPLLAMVLIAAGSAALASGLASARLGSHGDPEDEARATATPSRAFRAGTRRRGLLAVLLQKELRLLARDPELLAAVALQLAYMVPAFGLIFMGGGVTAARLAAACVLFSSLLPSSLAWLTICGEDAPDLMMAAPVSPDTMLNAKLLAACLPALALVALPVFYVLSIDFRAGLLALLFVPVAAVGAALQQYWIGRPQPRRTFRHRQRGSMLLAVSEYVMAGCWAGTVSLLVHRSPWALLPGLVAVSVLLGSRLLRAKPE
jgi:ABC-2 type transport system permease protein